MTNNDLKRFYGLNTKEESFDFVRLGSNGLIPSNLLPSYVDDVIEGYYYNSKFYEDSDHTKQITGEKGKIYLDIPTGNTYRWGTTQYVPISIGNAVKKIEVTNISQMTDDQINSVDCGDIVVKNESGNKHTYIVSYKQNEQGICLTYTDASVVETVSYDYVEGHWVYNSTDITPILNQ